MAHPARNTTAQNTRLLTRNRPGCIMVPPRNGAPMLSGLLGRAITAGDGQNVLPLYDRLAVFWARPKDSYKSEECSTAGVSRVYSCRSYAMLRTYNPVALSIAFTFAAALVACFLVYLGAGCRHS